MLQRVQYKSLFTKITDMHINVLKGNVHLCESLQTDVLFDLFSLLLWHLDTIL